MNSKKKAEKASKLLRGGSIYDDIDFPSHKKDIKRAVQAAYKARLLDYIKCSHLNYTQNSVYDNATQMGFVAKLNAEQKMLLKKISRNTEIQRICLVTGKGLVLVMATLAIGTLACQLLSPNDLYELIRFPEIHTFIVVALCVIPCVLIEEPKSEKTQKYVKRIVEIGFGKRK